MTLPINQIVCGAAEEILPTFPAESVNCCISSPPYWALRDYGVDGQLGLESTFEGYVDKLCNIYDEVKRVLRKDGTCFVNLGDTYSVSGGSGTGEYQKIHKQFGKVSSTVQNPHKANNLPAKSLCLIPQRFAIEMVNRGWILRNCLIWHKPNPMPSSAKDRFTVDFEYVYFFVKNKKYWFESQYEPQSQSTIEHAPRKPRTLKGENEKKVKPTFGSTNELPLGRNKRCVWTIPTQPRSEAHFATFPEKLIEPMIKAGCPKYVCKKCGKVREKVYETVDIKRLRKTPTTKPCNERSQSPNDYGGKEIVGFGYTNCGCNAGWRTGIVLDPFMGSGTTAKVAAQLGRDYAGIELNPEYIEKIAKPFVGAVETGVSVAEQRTGQKGLFE